VSVSQRESECESEIVREIVRESNQSERVRVSELEIVRVSE